MGRPWLGSDGGLCREAQKSAASDSRSGCGAPAEGATGVAGVSGAVAPCTTRTKDGESDPTGGVMAAMGSPLPSGEMGGDRVGVARGTREGVGEGNLAGQRGGDLMGRAGPMKWRPSPSPLAPGEEQRGGRGSCQGRPPEAQDVRTWGWVGDVHPPHQPQRRRRACSRAEPKAGQPQEASGPRLGP